MSVCLRDTVTAWVQRKRWMVSLGLGIIPEGECCQWWGSTGADHQHGKARALAVLTATSRKLYMGGNNLTLTNSLSTAPPCACPVLPLHQTPLGVSEQRILIAGSGCCLRKRPTSQLRAASRFITDPVIDVLVHFQLPQVTLCCDRPGAIRLAPTS